MSPDAEAALIAALKAISDGQRQIIEELKSIKTDRADLVPLKMPDGSTHLVPRSSLQASTKDTVPSQMHVIESKPLAQEPWPNPDIPRKPPVR